MSIGRHTTYNLIGSAIPVAVALVTVPIYLKLVGVERYGVLSIAWLLLGYFGVFDLGLGRASAFRIAALRDAKPQQRADAFWAAVTLNALLGLIGTLVLWAVASYFFNHSLKVDEQLRGEILASLPLLAASVPVATLTGVLTGALQGRERFGETNAISVGTTVLYQVLPLLLTAVWGPNLSLLLASALTTRLLALALLARRCAKDITHGQRRRFSRTEAEALVRYGGWITVTSLFGPILFMVDRFAIGAALGAAAVAAYNVPMQLAKQVAIVPSALTNALFPRLSASTATERQASARQATRTLACLVSPLVLGGILLMEPFLRIWVGPGIGAEAAPIGRVLLVGFWANAFALVPYTRLQSAGRPDLVTKVLLVEIPIYLLALYIGLAQFGLLGAALALSARFTLDYILLTFTAGSDFGEAPLLIANFALLIAATLACQHWTIAEPGWWAASTALSVATATLAWRSLPPTVKRVTADRLRRATFRAS